MVKKRKRIKIYSALEVANICGVVNQTAINWIKNGSLKAVSTGYMLSILWIFLRNGE